MQNCTYKFPRDEKTALKYNFVDFAVHPGRYSSEHTVILVDNNTRLIELTWSDFEQAKIEQIYDLGLFWYRESHMRNDNAWYIVGTNSLDFND